jgi:hypothetical protein
MDAQAVRDALEAARADPSSPEEIRDKYRGEAREYENFLQKLRQSPGGADVARAQWAEQQIAEATCLANDYDRLTRITTLDRQKFETLRAWQIGGGSLGYHTPPNPPPGEKRQLPHSEAIDYFMVAYKRAFGGRVSADIAKRAIQDYTDFHFQNAEARLTGGTSLGRQWLAWLLGSR